MTSSADADLWIHLNASPLGAICGPKLSEIPSAGYSTLPKSVAIPTSPPKFKFFQKANRLGSSCLIVGLTPLLASGSALALGRIDDPQIQYFVDQTDQGEASISTDSNPPKNDKPVLIEADYLVEEKDQEHIIATGDVQVRYDQRLLRAEKVIYRMATGRIYASGGVVITEVDGSKRYAREIEVTDKLTDGVATPFVATINNGGTVVASAAQRETETKNQLTNAIYTACRTCADEEGVTPTWALRARSVTQNDETQTITYRDAVLDIKGVPLFYAPYFAHPDPSVKRRSGLLAPDLGHAEGLGFYGHIPYFWAISDSQDLTIAPQIYSNVVPLLVANHRKHFYSGEMESDFSLTHEHQIDSDGNKFGEQQIRGHLFSHGLFDLNEDWQWGFGLEHASDNLFLYRYDIKDIDDRRGLLFGQSRRMLSQLFAVRHTENSYASITSSHTASLRGNDDDATFLKTAPYVEYFGRFKDPLLGGEVGVQLGGAYAWRDGRETVRAGTDLKGELGQDYARGSAQLSWQKKLIMKNGIVLRPKIYAQSDIYHSDDRADITTGTFAAQRSETIDRHQAGTELKVSWPLLAKVGKTNLVIEPTISGIYTTQGGNKYDLPIEESVVPSLDRSTLFQTDPVAGSEKVLSGARLNAGVKLAAALGHNNQAELFIGKQWRENKDDVFDRLSNLDGTVSDYVLSGKLQLGSRVNLLTNARLAHDNGEILAMETRLSARPHKILRLNADYTTISEKLRSAGEESQLRGEITATLTKNWEVTYGVTRDMDENKDLTRSFGVTYLDGCTRLSLTYNRSELQDRSDNFRIQLGLATLGQFGVGSNEIGMQGY